jgi:hypothetical protein
VAHDTSSAADVPVGVHAAHTLVTRQSSSWLPLAMSWVGPGECKRRVRRIGDLGGGGEHS